MPHQPELRSERLLLRPFRVTDAADVQRLAGAFEIADTTKTVPHPYPDGAAEAWIASHAPAWDAGMLATFAIIDSPSGGLVGAVGLAMKPEHALGELGYWIGVPFWNRGFATEASRALLDFGFSTLRLHRIQARHFTRNPASGRVMQKLGMTLEGVMRGAQRKWDRFEDLAMYAVLASEWRNSVRADGVSSAAAAGRSSPLDCGMLDLVFIDVDGTLVGSSREVTPAVWEAIERARARGLRLALCSGRPAFGATLDFAQRVAPDGWHIFQNGASVVLAATRESRSARMPEAAVAMLVGRARDTGRILELYADDEYVVQPDADRARRHASLLKIEYSPRPFDALRGPVVRAQWLIARTDEETVLAEPHDGLTMSPSVAPAMPDSLFINLTPRGVDKGSAVRSVTAAYGLSLDRVMYVGDGRNDAVAMRAVGVPVAMANAEEEAIAAAQHVVGDVDEDGLVEAIEMAMRMP